MKNAYGQNHQYNHTSDLNDKSTELFDLFFFKSINSPDYYVIHQKDFKKLKSSLSFYKDSTESIISALQLNNQVIKDSLLSSKSSMDRISKLLNSNSIEQEKNKLIIQNQLFSIRIFIIFLAALSIFMGYNYFKIKGKYNSDLGSFFEIEQQFDAHKKNFIERERKLLRQIIDLKNKIESLS
jgi:hypothetical protein